jgi:hypothetical protein
MAKTIARGAVSGSSASSSVSWKEGRKPPHLANAFVIAFNPSSVQLQDIISHVTIHSVPSQKHVAHLSQGFWNPLPLFKWWAFDLVISSVGISLTLEDAGGDTATLKASASVPVMDMFAWGLVVEMFSWTRSPFYDFDSISGCVTR